MEIYIHAKQPPLPLKFVFIILLLLIVGKVSAQETVPLINSKLYGKVLDSATKQPIPGAVVHIKGITHQVVSDEKGNFVFITGQKFPYTLVISYIGYNTVEIVATGSPVEIRLKESVNKLNDVVIIGYGTQNVKDVTGAISAVPKENLNQVSSSVDNLLRGSAPGIQVTQSSGQPGASASIRIRGGNSITGGNEPLYVIDGFPVYNDNSNVSTGAGSGAGVNALSTINPSDIESIEILKDASSTAIYGSRGANGVVIITTKKGKRGTNNISYQGYYGQQKVSNQVPLLNGSQWASLHNDILASINQQPSFTPDQITALGQGYNWQREAFRQSGVQNHELLFSGGDEKSRYAVAGNYFDQDGIVLNTNFKRYSVRINYDRDISTKFKIGVNTTTSYSTTQGAAANTGTSGLSSPNLITSVINTSPAVPIKDQNGNYNLNNPYASAPGNPIVDLLDITNQTHINRTLGNFFGEYTLLPGLKAKVSLGADLISTKQNYYAPSNTSNGYATLGYATVGASTVNTWLNENTVTYDKTISENHFLSVLGGYTTQHSQSETVTAGSKNFVSDATTYNSLQSGSQPLTPTSSAYSWALNSFLARVNYSFAHKYNVTLSARADGSSRFGEGNKWGYFPSAGISWNASEESFIKRVSAISNLKLRFSAGETGNQEIGQYQSLATLSPVNYDFNSTLVTGFAANRLSNPDLKWEKTAQFDGGFDLGLIDNRITLVFDAYYKKTNDLLLNIPIPLSTGYSSSLQNTGSVQNKGLEFGLNTENITGSGFTWKSSIVYSLNRNKVLSLGESETSFFPVIPNTTLSTLQPVIIKVGLPLGTFWGYKTNGIFQNQAEINNSPTLDTKANTKPGDRKYVDVNGDGKITAAGDKVALGNPQPKFIGSFSNTFTYKHFDLLVFLQGSYGGQIFNALQQQLEITNLTTNAWADVANRWTPTNPSNSVPRASNSPVAQMSDRYIQDGSYLRVKNLVLGYNFSNNLLNKIYVKQIRIYASAQNLATWTKYRGYDPEVSSFEQNNTAQGIDYGAYPNYRTFLLGLNVTL
jgi:TonB-linked SusC/RagA family outer membrane protein